MDYIKKSSIALATALVLSGCGGGSSSVEETPPPVVKTTLINGMAIKGPLANANISVYLLDSKVPHGKGALISSGTTNSKAFFENFLISGELASHYIVEVTATDSTVDLSTNAKPKIETFRTIVNSESLKQNQFINLSPFTSLITEHTLLGLQSGKNLEESASFSNEYIASIFGFQASEESQSLLNIPATFTLDVVTNEQRQMSLQMRIANELFSDFIHKLKIKYPEASENSLITNVAKDLQDGEFDGESLISPALYSKDDLTLLFQSSRAAFIEAQLKAKSDLVLEANSLFNTIITQEDLISINLSNLTFSQNVDIDLDGITNAKDEDDDNDGVFDSDDAFPLNSEESLDTDGDGIGNNSDLDDDNDGVLDSEDLFPLDSTEYLDNDRDGIGNNADNDDDNDSVPDVDDVFPFDANEWLDTDLDGIGNNADNDDDNDGVADANDAFPLDPAESVDTDSDSIGNNADTDDDNDSVLDAQDAFPLDPTEWLDTDLDGVGNNADTDDDNDGVADVNDAFPLDPTEYLDTDGDGIGNNADADDDNDGVSDNEDEFPLDSKEWLDTDKDGLGNNADTDDDNDGVPDADDAFPLDSSESIDTDKDGIGNNADLDDDNDSFNDTDDAFPLDPKEWFDTDGDGIGNNADTDDDNDGVPDTDDALPLDPTEHLDTDGDGIGNNADTDDDNDSVLDHEDAFPLDPTEWLDTDLDGIGNNKDSDDDNDGVLDSDDIFPLDSTEQLDFDSDGKGDNADLDDDNDGKLDVNDNLHITTAGKTDFSPNEIISLKFRVFLENNVRLNLNSFPVVTFKAYDKQTDILLDITSVSNAVDESNNQWKLSLNALSNSGSYYLRVSFGCIVQENNCVRTAGADWRSFNDTFYFTVNCPNDSCIVKNTDPVPEINLSSSSRESYFNSAIQTSSGDLLALISNNFGVNTDLLRSQDSGISWTKVHSFYQSAKGGILLERSANQGLVNFHQCTNSASTNVYVPCISYSKDGMSWNTIVLPAESNFGNCQTSDCSSYKFSISNVLENTNGEVAVYYYRTENNVTTSYITTSNDLYSWTTPRALDFDYAGAYINRIIKSDTFGYIATVYTNHRTFYTSEDGVTWQFKKHDGLSPPHALTEVNGMVSYFTQNFWAEGIYRSNSTDFVNFSSEKLVVPTGLGHFDVVPLKNGLFGFFYTSTRNGVKEVYFQAIK